MARSLKKGPYTFPRLLKRVKDLNEKGKKEVTIQMMDIRIKIINVLIFCGD